MLPVIFSFGHIHAAEKINLPLLASVTVEHEWVVMSDLVDLAALGNDSNVSFLHDIVVSRSPVVSASRLFAREQLSKRLERYSHIELSGADEVEVRRKSQLVKAEDIQHEIRRQIVQLLDVRQISEDQFRVSGLERIHDLRVPGSDQIQIIVERFQPQLPSANPHVWVDIVSGNKRLQSLKVPVKLEIIHPVWTLTRDMNKGDLITAEDITPKIEKNSNFKYLPAFEEAIGFEVKTQLFKGMALPSESLTGASDFARGETMLATLQSGVVNLQVPVKLLSPANSGETVVAQRVNGRKVSVLIGDNGAVHIVGKYSDEN